ncbi:hypothetical protein [Gilliamella sp. ESL0250]|uniref:hypothetical protein n=1 Tax=Gilliamella sp. ESL0250 TaxID=2705036 RepID=UPI00158077AB|nr:hypothetical protein [Gilliamella sp. ESL0250]NUF50205.1 hypothetical protein [Gilliamella sp. ESL0250]
MTYPLNIQALSAVTKNVIQGSAPYLTFDGGKTKASTTEGLLGITLSDGTTITPATNISTPTDPIVLPNAGETFANVGMFVPTSTNSIELKALIDAPYNYWGDDDGDGEEENGVTATGSLSVSFTDRYNQKVSRSHVLDICGAPYKVVLTSTDGMLITRYGVPNSSTFSGSTVSYFITPKSQPKLCYIKAGFTVIDTGEYAGPADMWSPNKGFIPQSTTPKSYDRNFPTTGANGLYFDLDIGGSGPLTWPTVKNEGITAIMIPNEIGNRVRVTLAGPMASETKKQTAEPSRISKPTLPQTFELVGYDSSGKTVIKYGFVLKKWFVNRGEIRETSSKQETWCASLGYRLIQVKDVTNANCAEIHSSCQGAKPSSIGNYYHRRINGGLFNEWGYMGYYADAGFVTDYAYWTSDVTGADQLTVNSGGGNVDSFKPSITEYGLCTYP